ncbi:LysR family transcriptional regulator [Amycolatopsis umgeniensis]|uniref:DNA-binding transcriptional LysR family regulator n=1 Tax=Amycolatopsis umgeniensis TaxID=336628 RepID=A0A841BFD7_9PSEU|nr:LysR family transcriptional regulator [Amycolatopsis umgeniensis]MBB5857505.1 DNA-binding transcriptional LysR family regulator [Amycolatopsis umgeniensis]
MESTSMDVIVDARRLQVLREMRERGTVVATAKALHLTPSAVSQQLATLARQVGVPLLSKHGRGVRLTGQAMVLLEHASTIHAQIEAARSDLASYNEEPIGQVAIGAFSTAIIGLVAPALADLQRTASRLRLDISEVEAPECYTSLDVGTLDLIIAIDYRLAPPRRDSRYHRTHLASDVFDFVVPDTHPLAQREGPVALEEFAGDRWVTTVPDGPCAELTIASCTTAGFMPDIHHTCNEWEGVTALVAAGAGVALVPRLGVRCHRDGLVVRSVRDNPPKRNIYAAIRAGAERSPVLTTVIEALRKHG